MRRLCHQLTTVIFLLFLFANQSLKADLVDYHQTKNRSIVYTLGDTGTEIKLNFHVTRAKDRKAFQEDLQKLVEDLKASNVQDRNHYQSELERYFPKFHTVRLPRSQFYRSRWGKHIEDSLRHRFSSNPQLKSLSAITQKTYNQDSRLGIRSMALNSAGLPFSPKDYQRAKLSMLSQIAKEAGKVMNREYSSELASQKRAKLEQLKKDFKKNTGRDINDITGNLRHYVSMKRRRSLGPMDRYYLQKAWGAGGAEREISRIKSLQDEGVNAANQAMRHYVSVFEHMQKLDELVDRQESETVALLLKLDLITLDALSLIFGAFIQIEMGTEVLQAPAPILVKLSDTLYSKEIQTTPAQTPSNLNTRFHFGSFGALARFVQVADGKGNLDIPKTSTKPNQNIPASQLPKKSVRTASPDSTSPKKPTRSTKPDLKSKPIKKRSPNTSEKGFRKRRELYKKKLKEKKKN